MDVAPLTGPARHRAPLRTGTEFQPERSAITVTHELLTIGRISVDIYPNDIGVDLEDVTSFGKYLGGSPSNVAVAAARHGRRTGVITRTGDDAFGTYLHRELRKFNVDDSFVTPVKEWPTAVTFCAIKPAGRVPAVLLRTVPHCAGPADQGRRAGPGRHPGRADLLVHGHRPVPGAQPRSAHQSP